MKPGGNIGRRGSAPWFGPAQPRACEKAPIGCSRPGLRQLTPRIARGEGSSACKAPHPRRAPPAGVWQWRDERRSLRLSCDERPKIPPAGVPRLGVEPGAAAQVRTGAPPPRDLRPQGDEPPPVTHRFALCRLRSDPFRDERGAGSLFGLRCRPALVQAVRLLRSGEPLPVCEARPGGHP
jgi:hypothetical protein